MAITVQKVMDANVYVNDESTHGQASEVTCPTITASTIEHTALGMVGSTEFFSGFESMEATIKWDYPSNQIKTACANFRESVELMVRSNKAVFGDGTLSEEVPIVIYMKGTPKQHSGGTYKKGDKTELDSVFAIHYYKEEVDGEEIIELDVLNNIYKVGGEDLLSEYRDNLGI